MIDFLGLVLFAASAHALVDGEPTEVLLLTAEETPRILVAGEPIDPSRVQVPYPALGKILDAQVTNPEVVRFAADTPYASMEIETAP